MKKVYVLYNPKAGKGTGEMQAKKLDGIMSNCELVYTDITKINSCGDFINALNENDAVIVSGGDGTLSRFATAVEGIDIKNSVYYYATGSGNDFLKDVGKNGAEPFLLNEYIENLPVITINGEDYCFVNGVGGGLDAYACVMGNKMHEAGKGANYVLNAIKGILYDYSPINARVWVDGKEFDYKNVWFASVMKGRYFGGGIMLAPRQNRHSGMLSAVIVHNVGRARILPIIPGAFTGKHVKHTKFVEVIEGSSIKVQFEHPVPLQIDGETVPDVTEYCVKTKLKAIK